MSETFAEFGVGAFGNREFGIGHDDNPGLKLVEQGVANRLGFERQASDDDVRFQFGISVQQRVLAGTPKIRKQDDARLTESAEKNDRRVVCLGKMVGRIGMQDCPGADSVSAVDVLDLARLAIKNGHEISVRR